MPAGISAHRLLLKRASSYVLEARLGSQAPWCCLPGAAGGRITSPPALPGTVLVLALEPQCLEPPHSRQTWALGVGTSVCSSDTFCALLKKPTETPGQDSHISSPSFPSLGASPFLIWGSRKSSTLTRCSQMCGHVSHGKSLPITFSAGREGLQA